jgi:hypothetical protein
MIVWGNRNHEVFDIKDEPGFTINVKQQKYHHEDPQVPATMG